MWTVRGAPHLGDIPFAAICAIRGAPHKGQDPRRPQMKATSLWWSQSPQGN